MPRRSSNADRIARAAEEAEAAGKEKAAAKKEKAAAKPRSRARKSTAASSTRMKFVWCVGKPGMTPATTYPYKELAAAEADAKARGEEYRVAKARVPMDDDE